MSDLYDSLEEDEKCEKKRYSNSFDLGETTRVESVKRTCESEPKDNYSFYLSKNLDEEKTNLLPNFKCSTNQTKIFLPKIENGIRDKGFESVGNLIVDNQILSKQGLQLNKDGSFTKSPRSDPEELPFITREYRNLQFQKKKTYKLKNKTSSDKVSHKNNFTNKAVDVNSKKEIIKTKITKDSNEEVLKSINSSSSRLNEVKTEKKIKITNFLRGSMKDENQKHQTNKSIQNLKKTKREMNLTDSQELLEKKNVFQQKKKENLTESIEDNSVSPNNSKHSAERIISKHQSDISLNAAKRNLNYTERHRLKNSYNLYLKLGSKKVLSDTNRSNFGDSSVEELPELPGVGVENGSVVDEDEEIFYKKLIEKEKSLKNRNQLSFRSDGPLEVKKFSNGNKINSYSGQKEERKNAKNRFTEITKSLSIDLKPQVDPSNGFSKKPSHYCVTEASQNSSKVELALKAKTYGYLVNARNVFNLKAQANKRLMAAEKKENCKIKENNIVSPKKVSDLSQNRNKLSKIKSSPLKDLPNVTERLPQSIDTQKTKKPVGKTKLFKVSEANQEGFTLPQVNNLESKGSKSRGEVLSIKNSREIMSL